MCAQFSELMGTAMRDADAYAERKLIRYEYEDFLASKRKIHHANGFRVDDLNPALYPHSRAVTRWAINKGRAAVFGGTGTHKTAIQGCWADEITRHELRKADCSAKSNR